MFAKASVFASLLEYYDHCRGDGLGPARKRLGHFPQCPVQYPGGCLLASPCKGILEYQKTRVDDLTERVLWLKEFAECGYEELTVNDYYTINQSYCSVATETPSPLWSS